MALRTISDFHRAEDPSNLPNDTLPLMLSYGLRLTALVVLLGAVFANMPSACAQDDVVTAKIHYQKATRLYEVGDYRQALDAFKAAHLAKPDPAFLYNIAQCHRQLGEVEQAVTLYKRFLAASPNAANRTEVEKRVNEMEGELASRKSKGATPAPIATAPASPLVEAQERALNPMPMSTLPPAAAGAASETITPLVSATALAEPKRPGSSLRFLRWVGAGLTLALVGGAVLSGVSASSRFSDLKNSCGATTVGCSAGDINNLKSRALLTNLLWGAAGVAAAGTGVMFYLTPHEDVVQVAWSF